MAQSRPLTIAWGLVLVLLVAGCAERPTRPGEPGSSTTAPPQDGAGETPPMAFNKTPQGVPLQAFWNDCEGFFTSFIWVGHHERFDAPPEWNVSFLDKQVTGIEIWGIDCPRFSWGPFERPVKMLIDSAGVDNVPQQCTQGITNVSFEILHGLWVDDAEVATWIRDTYNLTTHHADIQTSYESTAASHGIYTWTMTDASGNQTVLHTTDDGEYLPYSTNNRFFWFPDESGIAYMDWSQENNDDSQYTWGHAAPPMTIADWHTDEYADFGATLHDLDATGEIAFFQDVLCEEPH